MKHQDYNSNRSNLHRFCAFALPATMLLLTVQLATADCPPPTVTAVSAYSQRQPEIIEVIIEFSLPMDPPSATETFNYVAYDIVTLEQLSVVRGSMRDARTVVMTMIPDDPALQSGATYEMIINYVWTDSSDPECSGISIAGDTKVRFTVPPCLQITRQPRSRTVSEDCPVTLEVSARRTDGSRQPPLHYQWFKNNQAIAGATNSTYTAAPIQVADSGATFHAEVGSTCATLVSSNAVITVTTDTIPLNLDSAEPGLAPNSVVLSFSSPCGTPDGRLVAQLASNQLNYNWSGDIFSTRAYVDCTGTNVIVLTTPQQPGKTYTVSVQNLGDAAGYQFGSGVESATFIAPERLPVPFGTLRSTTLGNQTLLEWTTGGILQVADLPSGPWSDVITDNNPYLVTPSPFPCTGDLSLSNRYYRVRWAAQ